MTEFGRHLLDQWLLDPEVAYLNHGTVGATPKRVLEKQSEWRARIERQPAAVLAREIAPLMGVEPRAPGALRAAASEVGNFLGVEGEDLVFVDNASAGVNAVLRSFALSPGDEIAITDHTYGAVANVARFVARERGAVVRSAALPFPAPDPQALVEAFAAVLTDKTRIAVLDHVSSDTALVMPVKDMAALARARGIRVLVDGAHAPGAIPVDIAGTGVDWYTANMHKWAMAPRPCGVLWAAPDCQDGLHPPVVSWGLDQGMIAEFDWVGTRDPTPWLAAPDGIAFMAELGLEAMRAYNHALVLEAAEMLRAHWRTPFAANPAMTGTMACVALPESFGDGEAAADALRDALWFEDRIEVHMARRGGRLWARLSAQVYNELADYQRLAVAVAARS
ncbi:MAG TPA: aminotransferase class V-fold PLP-dependent enzyme [Alphaproteobacteria bacterium]|nr:aminotransferase class V-fold PLP-dependent enzyme [Alphaproteobacteria bacterium]